MAASEELWSFVELASTQKNAACVSVIQRAINNKRIFVFSELLEVSSVRELKNGTPEFVKAFNTLELFAYGTYGEYKENPNQYLELTPTQLEKLKKLTIISISMETKVITYESLMKKLDISDLRSLEDLIIDTFYSGHLKGKLNQRDSMLTVTETSSRDVRKENIDSLIQNLMGLKESSKYLYECVKSSSHVISDRREAEAVELEDLQSKLKEQKAIIKNQIESGEISNFRDREFSDNTFARTTHNRAPKRIKSVGGASKYADSQAV